MAKDSESAFGATFSETSIGLGREMQRLGLIPDFSECPMFSSNFREKIYRNVEHLLDGKDEEANYHPHHHLYLGEMLLRLGYAVYGKDFRQRFADELGFYSTVFASYSNKNDVLHKYLSLRKQNLEERLRVLKAHDVKGAIKVDKAHIRYILSAASEIRNYESMSAHLIQTAEKNEKERRKKILKIKDDFYQIAALFKGVNGFVSDRR
jgi:hypothetical protein